MVDTRQVIRYHKKYIKFLKKEIKEKTYYMLYQMKSGNFKRNDYEFNIVYYINLEDYYDCIDIENRVYVKNILLEYYKEKKLFYTNPALPTSFIKSHLVDDLIILLRNEYSEDTMNLLLSMESVNMAQMILEKEYYIKCFKELIWGQSQLIDFKKLFKDMEQHYLTKVI
jgi:hypothetical protein